MSKTLSLKKLDVVAAEGGKVTFEEPAPAHLIVAPHEQKIASIPAYTAAQLRAMLAEIEPNGVPLDPTMGLPIAPTDPAELAAKAALPPPEDRKQGAAPQLPPAVHGSFSLGGIPLIAPGVDLTANINPATNLPYVQTGMRAKTMISPPPTRNFR